MKRFLGLLIAVFMILSCWTAFAEEILPKQRVKVACVGDSITFGDGIKKADRPTMSYPAKLQGFLGDEYEVVNFGIVSLCLCETSDKPYTKNAIFQKSIEYEPDIVIIMLGTNDSKTNNWDKCNINEGMRAFLGHYTSLPSNPKIYIMAPPPAYNEGAWDIQPNVIPQIRDEYINFTKEENIAFIDIYSVTKDMPELFPDNIHPNTVGAEIIAGEVCRAMLEEQAAYPRGRADTDGASVWAIDYINKAWNLCAAEDSFFKLYANPISTSESAVLFEGLSRYINGKTADIAAEPYTRQGFALMLYDIITAVSSEALTSNTKTMTFSDIDDIDENAKQAIAYLYSNDIIKGNDLNMFMPGSVITKEEALTMIVRVYDLLDSYTK